jgi:nucleoside-diphosphate-sugar epimerase
MPGQQRVFVAGAAGVIGRRLCGLLVADGWAVVGSTRSRSRAAALRSIGVDAVVVDVFAQEALSRAVAEARPAVVVHQLTDLPPALDPTRMAEARIRNARVRDLGTRNLVQAAIPAGAERIVAQSIAFAYAAGPIPFPESAPLDLDSADPSRALSVRAVASLERQVLEAAPVGIVLRYGRLYGPGTGFDDPPPGGPVHVDAAADAARRALTGGARGIYNIAESDGTVSSDKAQRELGWSPTFRVSLGQS